MRFRRNGFLETTTTFPRIRAINTHFLGYESEDVGPPRRYITVTSRKSEASRRPDRDEN
jgi:hypothetical protein